MPGWDRQTGAAGHKRGIFVQLWLSASCYRAGPIAKNDLKISSPPRLSFQGRMATRTLHWTLLDLTDLFPIQRLPQGNPPRPLVPDRMIPHHRAALCKHMSSDCPRHARPLVCSGLYRSSGGAARNNTPHRRCVVWGLPNRNESHRAY